MSGFSPFYQRLRPRAQSTYSVVCAKSTPMTEFPILNALIFAALGVLVFVAAFSLVIKLAPLDLWKEIQQERNVAAAIFAGAVAVIIVAVELAVIAYIRHRYMDTPLLQASFQVIVGGFLVFLTGYFIGNS